MNKLYCFDYDIPIRNYKANLFRPFYGHEKDMRIHIQYTSCDAQKIWKEFVKVFAN